nr:cytochrome P450 [Pharsalia antennata]
MFLTGLILIALICMILCYIVFRNNTHLSNIPIPPCSLLLGHLLDFKDSTKILKILTNYTIQYGGLLRIYVPPTRPSVLISDSEALQVLLASNTEVEKAKDYNFCKPWLGSGLLTSGVDKWKYHRRMLTPCFGRLSLLKNFTDVFDAFGNILIKKFEAEVNNKNINIFPLIKMYSLDVLCETSMGTSVDAQENSEGEYVKSLERMCEIVINRSQSPYKRFDFIYRFTEDYRRQTEALKIINCFFCDIIKAKGQIKDETKKNRGNNLKIAFLDLLLKFYADDKFTLNDVKDEVNTFLLGGHDTTATGIAFTLYALARHPKIQEKLIEEQLNIFGKLNNNSPSYDDLQNMKYLEMVIYETLRLYPPIPLIGRRIINDTDIGNGVILPKYLNVGLFIYGCHHNPKYFADPEKFIPERFEGNNVKPYTFLPFSSGPRNCIGKKFAVLQMKSCISKIVRHFILQPSDPEYKLKLVPRMTLVARNGIRLSLRKRISD